ncbi:protein Skeletor, isoforms B/C-like [Amblyomma americanum]
MPPIVIGGVVLVLVACVGLLVATSGPSDEGGDTSIDPSKWTYFGVELGTLSRTEHGVSGKVYAATESLICITEFNYDGTGPDAEVMAGTTDTPD